MNHYVVLISDYLHSKKLCGNLMLSRSITSAFDFLSISYDILSIHIPEHFSRYFLTNVVKVNILWLISWLIRLKFSKSLALKLISLSNDSSNSTVYLYDGYDNILIAALTPRQKNHLISSDLYSRAAWNSFLLRKQSLVLKLYRFFYFLRALIVEFFVYQCFFKRVYFVSSFDLFLYTRRFRFILHPNGFKIPFTLDSSSSDFLLSYLNPPHYPKKRLLFTGNFDQYTHVNYLLECLNCLPKDLNCFSITAQSSSHSEYFLSKMSTLYPFVSLIGKVPCLDKFYSDFDFIIFTNRLTTGIQTKYLHAFRAGSVVVAPSSTAVDFGPNLKNKENILLYDDYEQVYSLIESTCDDPVLFDALKIRASDFYNRHHSFSSTIDFIHNYLLSP